MAVTTTPHTGGESSSTAEAQGRKIGGGLLDPKMLWKSLPDAVKKLDPRVQLRNPVMFVVEIGALVTLYTAITKTSPFNWTIVVWLWLTVVFANLAEAVAEGRGKALTLGDHVVVEAGETIPGDGDVVEGVASVDESAITGESAPVIRESGGDRSA